MFCSHCGKELNNEAVVCPHCGVPTGNAAGFEKATGAYQPPVNNGVPNYQQPVGGGMPNRYAPQGYMQQAYPPPKPEVKNICGILGFVFSLLSLFTGVSLIAGLVLSIIGMVKRKNCTSGNGFAIAGLVISICIFAFALLIVLMLFVPAILELIMLILDSIIVY